MVTTKKEDMNEFVDSEGGIIGGDRNVNNDSEIETGPVQKPFNDNSDYEKGVSTTTDRATRYRQNIPWFAVYSYRSTSGRGLPINENNPKIITKRELEEEIKEDLVKKNKIDREVWSKDYDNKIEKTVEMINDTELTDIQLNKLKDAVLAKLKEKDA
jgi:hypothetical protein